MPYLFCGCNGEERVEMILREKEKDPGETAKVVTDKMTDHRSEGNYFNLDSITLPALVLSKFRKTLKRFVAKMQCPSRKKLT